jgi:hypothetical protein
VPPSHRRLALMPIGPPASHDEALLAALVPILSSAFASTVVMSRSIGLPEDAYNPSRRQYHSTVLLDALARHKRAEWSRLIGIADVDLYTPDLNFVFGEADTDRGVAVFSLVRLHPGGSVVCRLLELLRSAQPPRRALRMRSLRMPRARKTRDAQGLVKEQEVNVNGGKVKVNLMVTFVLEDRMGD